MSVRVSSGAVFTILKENLKLLSARWIPNDLIEEQKQERVWISYPDKTSIHYFEPQRKFDNKVWTAERC